MKRKYYMVLDTETIGNTTETKLAYDIGYVITDRNGKIYKKVSYIVKEIFEQTELIKTAYYANKLPLYYEGLKQNKFIIKPFAEIWALMNLDCINYDVVAICAYNSAFDKAVLNIMAQKLLKMNRFFSQSKPYYCIWNMACQLICTQQKYINYCVDNNFLSDNNNIKTSVEVVYSFLSNNPDFKEVHTGLEDSLIETEIMTECFKKKKKFNKEPYKFCWQLPQRRREKMDK